MRHGHRFKWRALTAGVVTLTLLMAMPIAGAAPDHKAFTASVTPSLIVAGEGEITITITNVSTSTKLGAARIHLDEAMEILDIDLDRPGWTHSGNQIAAASPSQGLQPGQSIVATVTIVTLQTGDRTYPIELEARQANHFNGTGNELNYVGGPLSVTVTGAAKACGQGGCDITFSENTTDASLTSQCATPSCGVLSLDLDQFCFDQDCVGDAAFWVPPAGATGKVKLELRIDGGEEGFSYYDFKHLKFYIAPTDSSDYFECGTQNYVIWCDYEKKLKDGDIIIKARVAAVDPRGFAS